METFTDDTVVALASFLAPHDMLSLALTCKRFGDKHGTADKKRSTTREESSSREVRQRTEAISLMEVAARTVLHAKWTDEEKKALPRREDESWIGLYNEFLVVFRLPLQFDKLAGDSIFHVDSKDRTNGIDKAKVGSMGPSWPATAICQNIMRAGKHRVSFQVNHSGDSPNNAVQCGIMRPTTKDISFINISGLDSCNPVHDDLSRFSLKDYEMLHNDNNVDCCLFSTYMGNCLLRRRWKEWEESELTAMDNGQRFRATRQNKCKNFGWKGQEQIRASSFKVGLVLDLDEGTLDVYTNDRRLGTMKSGLVGEYCWTITLISKKEVSVSIGR